jgi:[glutamine synthetase] adenylyltransferase / [glutamine synthetase]-adenylyl-L-tyrosine phosphorylase
VHDLQTHSLPESGEELERCAIRAGYYEEEDRMKGAVQFGADHERHTGLVNQAFRAFFYAPKTSVLLKASLRAGSRRHPARSASR